MNAHGTFTATQWLSFTPPCTCSRLLCGSQGASNKKQSTPPTHSQLFRVAWFQTRNVQSFLLYEWVFYHRIFAQHQAPCKCTGKTASGVFLFPSPRLFEIGFEKLRPKTSAKTKRRHRFFCCRLEAFYCRSWSGQGTGLQMYGSRVTFAAACLAFQFRYYRFTICQRTSNCYVDVPVSARNANHVLHLGLRCVDASGQQTCMVYFSKRPWKLSWDNLSKFGTKYAKLDEWLVISVVKCSATL